MTPILKDLRPKNVFKYFEIISGIPRGSGHEKAISDYVLSFARELGLWVRQDEANNIYIKKPASIGYEKSPTVILQGHMDMVCEKDKNISHDFEKEGLTLIVDDDYIKADGTTLGADNGVAIAYQMAVLADDTLKHPALEIVMTTDEERGMTGAAHLHAEYLEGRILINLDTDVEGEFLISCAGGVRAYIKLKLEEEVLKASQTVTKIVINGLRGGHSGADIHLERANAHILMGRVLNELRKHMDFNICHISGGTKDNVITRECECVIALSSSDISILEKVIQEMSTVFEKEYHVQDPNIQVKSSISDKLDKMFTQDVSERIIDTLLLMPNGIISFDKTIQGLVETSLNLGILEVQGEFLKFGSAIRSTVPSKKEALKDQLRTLCKNVNGDFDIMGDYPAWEYKEDSKLRELSIKVYKEMYAQEPQLRAIHAGLECGFIAEKLDGIDMIAIGPNVLDIHSPNERVSISSMTRVYEYLVRLLENIVTY